MPDRDNTVLTLPTGHRARPGDLLRSLPTLIFQSLCDIPCQWVSGALFCVTLAGARSGLCVRKFPVSLHTHARLILRKALLLDTSQAPLPREAESDQGRGSPRAGQGLQVVPLELSLTRKISSGSQSPGSPRQENCQGLFLLWYRATENG